jgi:two-component system chemotaxis response regulator CheB
VIGLESLQQRIRAIVIGASAGGLEALSVLLPALPAALQAPVFIVLHLPRDRTSLLVDIFGPRCAVPVREAEDKEPVKPGTVYFAPADYHLLIDSGPTLALSADALVHYSRPSIDVLFESAADVYGPHLLGIILSGANQDGAEGLAAVHRAGGVTVVQSPEGAPSPYMLESALARTDADFVTSLEEIATILRALGGGE